LIMDATPSSRSHHREPWNKGKLVGQKAPFKPKDIWALRVRLQQAHRLRELALLNLGIDSKLRACDLVSLKVRDIVHGERVATRAIVQQKKTGRPVQFEITAPAREAAEAWIREARLRSEDYLFPSRIHGSPHICTRQYARMLREWLTEVGLDWRDYGTHSMRRTKATAHLSQDARPARRATAARAFEHRLDRPVSRRRGRRRTGDLRAG
jgi:integrase